jgi:hypothetical protein
VSGSLCSRCPTSLIAAEDSTAGVVTDRACAVFSADLPPSNAHGNGHSTLGIGGLAPAASQTRTNSVAVKCMPCRHAARLRLPVIPEEGAASMRQHVSQDHAGYAGLAHYDGSSGSDAAAPGGDPSPSPHGMGWEEEEEASLKRRMYYGVLRWNASSAYPDGAKYTGEIVDGAPHGRGALVTKYGLYVGEFVRGKRHGKAHTQKISKVPSILTLCMKHIQER